MNVKVKFFAYFRELFGAKANEVGLSSAAPIRDLLKSLCDTPQRRAEIFNRGELKPHVVVMINGLGLPAETGLDTRLKDGDVVSLFPLMGGG